VILLHRLMKNSVSAHEYVLLTRAAAALANLDETALRAHSETVDGFGEQSLWLADAADLPEPAQRAIAADQPVAAPHTGRFRNLPGAGPGWWQSLLRRFARH